MVLLAHWEPSGLNGGLYYDAGLPCPAPPHPCLPGNEGLPDYTLNFQFKMETLMSCGHERGQLWLQLGDLATSVQQVRKGSEGHMDDIGESVPRAQYFSLRFLSVLQQSCQKYEKYK